MCQNSGKIILQLLEINSFLGEIFFTSVDSNHRNHPRQAGARLWQPVGAGCAGSKPSCGGLSHPPRARPPPRLPFPSAGGFAALGKAAVPAPGLPGWPGPRCRSLAGRGVRGKRLRECPGAVGAPRSDGGKEQTAPVSRIESACLFFPDGLLC